RDEVGAPMRSLGGETEAVRSQARAELQRNQRNGCADRDECCPPLRIHAASETEEPAEAGSSRGRISRCYELAMSPWKTSFSMVPAPLPRSCQWRTIRRGLLAARLGAV